MVWIRSLVLVSIGTIIPLAYKLAISYSLGNPLMMQYVILTQFY